MGRWIAALVLLLAFAEHNARAECCGDCNGDGRVTVNEILSAIDNAQRECDAPSCCGDCDGDSQVQVHEIVAAVRSALTACGRDSLCGGPLSSVPQLCHFRAGENPLDSPDLLSFQWDWSDAENDINLICVGLQDLGYDKAPWIECTTKWEFPLPTRPNGQAIIPVYSPWLPMTIAAPVGVPLNGPGGTSSKRDSSNHTHAVVVTFQVGDAGGHMSNLVQMQLQLIR